jgi:hypothetical protein
LGVRAIAISVFAPKTKENRSYRLKAIIAQPMIQFLRYLLPAALVFVLSGPLQATSVYNYGADEYVTIASGISPNGKLAITAHGEGEYGFDNFHFYLTDAISGKTIGPLNEIVSALDTGAGASCAKWSEDSQEVVIIHRVARHQLEVVSYKIQKGRAILFKTSTKETPDQLLYWQNQCTQSKPSERIFGKPKPH